jgi:hypothetical protein
MGWRDRAVKAQAAPTPGGSWRDRAVKHDPEADNDAMLDFEDKEPTTPLITGRGLLKSTVEMLPEIGTVAGGMLGAAGTAWTGPGAIGGGLVGAGLGRGAGQAAKDVLSEYLLDEERKPLSEGLERVAMAVPRGAAEQASGEILAKGLGTAFGGVQKYFAAKKGMVKPNIGEIEAAAQRMGGKASPGMTTTDPTLAGVESSLEQSPTISGYLVRRQKKGLVEGIEKGAKQVLSEATALEKAQAGDQIKQRIIESVNIKLDPLSASYDELSGLAKDIPLNKKGMERVALNITKIPEAAYVGSDAHKIANQYSEWIKNETSSEGIRRIRSKALALARDKNASYEARQVAGEIADKMSSAFDRSVTRAAIETGRTKKEGAKIAGDIISQLKETNKGYKGLIEMLEDVGGKRGAKIGRFKTPNEFVEALEDIPSERIADKFFQLKNIEQLKNLKTHLPEEFELVRQAKLADIRKQSFLPGGEQISVPNLVRALKDVDNETRKLLLGPDANMVLKDIETLYAAKPKMMGPSGTPQGLEFSQDLVGRVSNEAARAIQYLFQYKPIVSLGGAAKGAKELIQSKPVKGLIGIPAEKAQEGMIRGGAGLIRNAIINREQ